MLKPRSKFKEATVSWWSSISKSWKSGDLVFKSVQELSRFLEKNRKQKIRTRTPIKITYFP